MARDATNLPSFSTSDFATILPAAQQAQLDYGLIAHHLKLAFTFATPDNTTLSTVPAGKRFSIVRAFWEVTTSFTGGTASAIGVSSDDTNYATPGDILGGAGGDLAATLVSTGNPIKGGTLGTKFGSNGVVVLGAGKVIKLNRVVSAFTAGAGVVHIHGFYVDL